MERILVVLDEREQSLELLRELSSVAAGAGADLVALSLINEAELDEHAEALASIERSERVRFDTSGDEIAKQIGNQLINAEFDETPYDTLVGRVADENERAEEILEVAESEGVDYIGIVGRRRSPTGKAIFGDTAQGVLLNFDGYVTVTMA